MRETPSNRRPSDGDSSHAAEATVLFDLTRSVTAVDRRESDSLAAGTRVGRFRIIRQLGSGGMGTVYLAEQLEPIARLVAIKMMSVERFSPEHRWRFAQEAQAMARMTHPGIAQLFDAGASADGQLYFVMEHVAGEPLGDWRQRICPSIEAVIQLLRDICRAVAHAHGKGVLHCDIKPTNVLVTDIDARPFAKLIDFGIARMVGESERHFAGTPAYMSPEQIAGGSIDTRSDVYALGVLLFETLTGRRFRDWCSGDVPRSELETRIASEPAVPRIDLPTTRLPKARRRELAAIVARAMAKDPEQRYASSDALADDLERWIRNEPVAAMRGGDLYRLGCLIRRQRALSTAAAAFVVVAGLLVWRLVDQLDETRRERNVARQVTELLLDTYRAADPYRYPGGSITARELLRASAEQAQRSRLERAERLRILETLGEVQSRLELFSDATSTFDLALGLVESGAERDALLVAKAATLMNGERFDDATAILDEVIDRLRFQGPSDSLADALLVRAEVAEYREELELARRLLDDAAPMVAQATAGDLLLRWQRRMGRIALAAGDTDGAIRWLDSAHETARQREGDRALPTLDILSDLALARSRAGDLEAAERDSRLIVELTERIWGEESPGLAIALSNLGAILQRRGGESRLEEAAVTGRRAYEINFRILGEDSMDTALAANNLANALGLIGRHGEAEPLHAAAVRGLRARLGDAHSHVGIALHNHGRNLMRLRRPEEAGRLIEQAGAILADSLGKDHPRYAAWQLTRAEWLLGVGRRQEALETIVAAEPAILTNFARESPEMARLMTLRASLADQP